MYQELASRILIDSVEIAGVTISEADWTRELSALGFETPEQVTQLKVFSSSPNVLDLYLEPVVRQLLTESAEARRDDDEVRETLRGVRQRLLQGLHISPATSLLSVRNSIAVILADSLPGDPTKLPRI
ncbi:MAG: hypothetical protein QOH70_672 [Blastocatellia bacterium]|jgi:hypothetical protein|nr:hypothetical protein [Blastocatellia bacterium]